MRALIYLRAKFPIEYKFAVYDKGATWKGTERTPVVDVNDPREKQFAKWLHGACRITAFGKREFVKNHIGFYRSKRSTFLRPCSDNKNT